MRLVVHIGSHKTGSTSIQEYCRSAPPALREAGILYPADCAPGTPGQHSGIKTLAMQDDPAPLQAVFAAAAAAAREAGAHTVLLSGEDLCVLGPGLAHRVQVAALRHFADTRIVLLLRNKRDYLYSAYKHHLLHAPALGEEAFVRGQVFSPRRCVGAWRQLKGAEVQVLSFDALRADLLGGFFRAVFGLGLQARLVANRSLDYLALLGINALLKPGGGALDRAALAAVLQARSLRPRHPALPVEDVIADGLTSRFPDEDWLVPDVDFAPALLERHAMAAGDPPDIAALAGDMATFYGAMQAHFRGRQGK